MYMYSTCTITIPFFAYSGALVACEEVMVGVVEEVRGGLQKAKEDNQRLLALNTTL